MSSGKPRFSWLAGLAAALSLVACYGTLAVIAVLGAIGDWRLRRVPAPGRSS